jgi:hypothetical protein
MEDDDNAIDDADDFKAIVDLAGRVESTFGPEVGIITAIMIRLRNLRKLLEKLYEPILDKYYVKRISDS